MERGIAWRSSWRQDLEALSRNWWDKEGKEGCPGRNVGVGVGRRLGEERGKSIGLCMAEHRRPGGWRVGTKELGSYPVGNREPVKAVELGRSWSDLYFGKISLAAQCPHFWWSLPFGEKGLTLRDSPVHISQVQISKWLKSQPVFKSLTMFPKTT